MVSNRVAALNAAWLISTPLGLRKVPPIIYFDAPSYTQLQSCFGAAVAQAANGDIRQAKMLEEVGEKHLASLGAVDGTPHVWFDTLRLCNTGKGLSAERASLNWLQHNMLPRIGNLGAAKDLSTRFAELDALRAQLPGESGAQLAEDGELVAELAMRSQAACGRSFVKGVEAPPQMRCKLAKLPWKSDSIDLATYATVLACGMAAN